MNSWIFAAASWCTIFVKAAIWCDYKIALSFSIRNKLSTISSDWWAWQRKRKSVHSACIWFIFVRFSLIKSLLFSSKYWNNGLLWSFHVIEGNICHLTFCNKLTSIKVYCVFMRDVPLLYWFQSFIWNLLCAVLVFHSFDVGHILVSDSSTTLKIFFSFHKPKIVSIKELHKKVFTQNLHITVYHPVAHFTKQTSSRLSFHEHQLWSAIKKKLLNYCLDA